MATMFAPRSNGRAIGHFVLHFFEMCAAMCVGFAVLDLAYFATASWFGYSDPFTELPVLSLLVVTFNLTVPMAAWMLIRHMPRGAVAEMSAAMVVLAIALLALAVAGAVPKSRLALLEHGLMMPAMLVPMLFRLDLYTGRHGHGRHAPQPIGT